MELSELQSKVVPLPLLVETYIAQEKRENETNLSRRVEGGEIAGFPQSECWFAKPLSRMTESDDNKHSKLKRQLHSDQS